MSLFVMDNGPQTPISNMQSARRGTKRTRSNDEETIDQPATPAAPKKACPYVNRRREPSVENGNGGDAYSISSRPQTEVEVFGAAAFPKTVASASNEMSASVNAFVSELKESRKKQENRFLISLTNLPREVEEMLRKHDIDRQFGVGFEFPVDADQLWAIVEAGLEPTLKRLPSKFGKMAAVSGNQAQ